MNIHSRRQFLKQSVVLSALGAVTLSSGISLGQDSSLRTGRPHSDLFLNFHRGGGVSRPENTLETFLWAWNKGAFPECDVQFTKDGVPVCFHDGKLGRIVKNESEQMTSKTVRELTWDEVRRFDVGLYKGEQFSPERIPTLDSVFAAMKGTPERFLYIDEKGLGRPQAERIAELVRQYGIEKQAFYTSGTYKKVREWKEILPEGVAMHWMGIVWGKFNPDDLENRFKEFRQYEFHGIDHLNCHIQTDLSKEDPFTPSSKKLQEMNKECTDRGIVFQVITWSQGDKPETYKRLLDLGITSFATDYPEVLLSVVHGR